MGCPVFPRLHGALSRGEHTKSRGGRSANGSVEIPREGIKRDQKYGDQYHGGIPHAVRLFLFFQHVSDRGAEEKNLQAREDTRGNFHKRKLMKQCHNKNRAADRRGRDAHQDRGYLPLHCPSFPRCLSRIAPRLIVADAGEVSPPSCRRSFGAIAHCNEGWPISLTREAVPVWAACSSKRVYARGEHYATTSTWEEWTTRFCDGIGLHGHVGVLRQPGRQRIDCHDPSRDRAGHHVSRYGRRLRLRRQRSAGGESDTRPARQSFSGHQIRNRARQDESLRARRQRTPGVRARMLRSQPEKAERGKNRSVLPAPG